MNPKPFHSYTMKQAVEERFILDVLKTYTPVDSYCKLIRGSDRATSLCAAIASECKIRTLISYW